MISTQLYNYLSQYPELDLVPYSMTDVGTEVLPAGATRPVQPTISRSSVSHPSYNYTTTTPATNTVESMVNPTLLTAAGVVDIGSQLEEFLTPLKEQAQKLQTIGAVTNTIAAAGELFTSLSTIGESRAAAHRTKENAQLQYETEVKALDNQVLYAKNLIADKFNQTMARNAVVMAAKNLNVTTANLLEQTKDAAYDATKDIEMLESNANLKKISAWAEMRQKEVGAKLSKNLAVSNLIGSLGKMGMTVGSGIYTGAYEGLGNLFSGNNGSLNATVYGVK